jgi:hypothetical protein
MYYLRIDPIVEALGVGTDGSGTRVRGTWHCEVSRARNAGGYLSGSSQGLPGGMIGNLSTSSAAPPIEVILDGTEKITRKLPDAVDLDHVAQGDDFGVLDEPVDHRGGDDVAAEHLPQLNCLLDVTMREARS